MAGIPQEGLYYASIPSNFFDDDARIDRLLDAQGWRGAGVYFYLLLRAYRCHGYYVEWCYADCATTARKMGGGMSAKNVEEAMRYCTQVGLWDKRLLEEWGILTSVDIQQNYLIAAKKARHKIKIISEYWLLEEKPPHSSLVSCGKIAGIGGIENHDCSKDEHDCNKDSDKCNKDDPSISMCMYDINTTTTTTSSKLESGASHKKSSDSSLCESLDSFQSSLLSEPLTDEEMEERQKKYGASLGQWERVTGRPLTPFELDDVCVLVDEYGEQWVIDAMSVAGRAGKLNLRYTTSILRNWKTDGRDVKKSANESDDERWARIIKMSEEGEGDV